MADSGIGAAVRRKEDHRFLTGNGNYVDDINRPGQTFAAFVRSPHAHATLGAVDTTKAAAAPGVIAVLTGADVAADEIGGLPCGWGITSKDGTPAVEPAWPILAQGKVRFVGDAVAAVIAETADQAKDAAELVDVAYTPLPAIAVTGEANKPGAPLVHSPLPVRQAKAIASSASEFIHISFSRRADWVSKKAWVSALSVFHFLLLMAAKARPMPTRIFIAWVITSCHLA
jgi:carbon-monoxide dehydrogenase large subunit